MTRNRVKKLSGEQLAELAPANGLELVHTHIHSLHNVTAMAGRLSGTLSPTSLGAGGSELAAEAPSTGTEQRGNEKGKKKALASTPR